MRTSIILFKPVAEEKIKTKEGIDSLTTDDFVERVSPFFVTQERLDRIKAEALKGLQEYETSQNQ